MDRLFAFMHLMYIHFQAPYRQEKLTRDQINYEKDLSQARVPDEWILGEINTLFQVIVQLKTQFKIGLSSVPKMCGQTLFQNINSQ